MRGPDGNEDVLDVLYKLELGALYVLGEPQLEKTALLWITISTLQPLLIFNSE